VKAAGTRCGKLAVIGLLATGGLAGPLLRAQPSTWIFRPGSMSESQLVAEFQGAVVYVQVKDANGLKDAGTGFLVLKDNVSGYFLTAGHVVAEAAQDPHQQVTVAFGTATDRPFPATVVKCVAEPLLDFALLRVDNPPAAITAGATAPGPPFAQLRPVDISLMPPDSADAIYAMGYPEISPTDPAFFHEQPVNFMTMTPDGSIEVRQATFAGNSGGPLLDAAGSSRGICREVIGLGATVARYVPLWQVQPLLQGLPVTERIKQLDERLRSGGLDRKDLVAYLKPTSHTPSNVELYLWAQLINSQRTAYNQAAVLIRELLIPALIQRGLPDQGIALAWAGSPKSTGDANLMLAQRANAYGQYLTALEFTNAALSSYGGAPADAEAISAQLLFARINLQLGNVMDARSTLTALQMRDTTLTDHQRGEVWELDGQVSTKLGDLLHAGTAFSLASKSYLSSRDYSRAAASLDSQALLDWGTGNPEKARTNLENAIDLYKQASNKRGASESLFNLYNVLQTTGHKAEAADALKKILVLTPENPRAPDFQAVLLRENHLF